MNKRAPFADPRDAPGQAPPITLSTPAKFLKGVGPVRAEALKRLGVFTAGELLFHIPHRYQDASTIKPIASIETGMDATIIGRVISKGVLPTRKGLRIFQAVVKDETGMIEVSWPGQPFLDRSIAKGDVLLLTGTVRFFHGRQLQPREFINLGDDDEGTGKGRVLAVYPATEGLSFKVIRGLIDTHLDGLLALVEEYLPAEVLRYAAVPALADSLRMVHRPRSLAEAMEGRGRLAFEELFFVHLLRHRAHILAREKREGIAFENRRALTSKLKASRPSRLTGAQTHARRDIVVDMCSPHRMHFFFQAEDGIRDLIVTGVQTCALPICPTDRGCRAAGDRARRDRASLLRSEEHTSELQSRSDLVCRLLLEKKKRKTSSDQRPRNTSPRSGSPAQSASK